MDVVTYIIPQYKGVTAENGYWKAYIYLGSVRKHLASCREETDAAQIYNLAAEEYFGEFARLNEAVTSR